MDPEPLVRILPDDAFQQRMKRLSVLSRIAGHRYGRIEAQDVPLFRLRPERETGDYGRSGMRGDLGEPRARARRYAEEVDKDALLGRHVLIDENADCLVVLERLQDGSSEFLLPDQSIA